MKQSKLVQKAELKRVKTVVKEDIFWALYKENE